MIQTPISHSGYHECAIDDCGNACIEPHDFCALHVRGTTPASQKSWKVSFCLTIHKHIPSFKKKLEWNIHVAPMLREIESLITTLLASEEEKWERLFQLQEDCDEALLIRRRKELLQELEKEYLKAEDLEFKAGIAHCINVLRSKE